jgi:hypothetical protein
MTYPTYTTPRSIPGAATPTYLNASLVSGYFAGQSFIVANTTDWYEVSSSGTATTNPLGTSGVFTLVVDYGSGTEEKILCASGTIPIGVNVPISVWTDGTYNGRGWDGTTPYAHTSGTNSNFNVFPVRTAVDDLQFNTAAANSLVSTNPNLGGVTAISGQSAVWNGISWTPATISGGGGGITSLTGDVTAIGTGAVAAKLVGTTSVSGVVNVIINANSTVTGTVASLTTLSGQYVVTSGSLTILSGQFVALSGAYATTSGNLNTTNSNLSTLSGQFVTLSGQYNTTSGIVTNNTNSIATISGKQVTDEANIASLSGSLSTLSGQYVVTSGSLTTLSGQFVTLSGQYNTTSGIVTTATGNIASLSGSLATLSGQYVATSGSLTTLSGQFVTLSGQYNTTSGIVTTATGNIASLSGSLASLSGQYVSTSGSLTTLSGQFVTLSGSYASTSGSLNTVSGVAYAALSITGGTMSGVIAMGGNNITGGGEIVGTDFKASGLTGATSATRYVGGTANGAPTSGTFAVGDFIVDQTGTIWVCTTAGTPGTWTTTISSHLSLRSASATVGRNEITLFSGSTASQTLTAPSNPIDGSNWTVINKASVAVTLSFTPSMIALGSSSGVTTFSVPANGSFSFVNYNGSQWYMVASNSATQLIGTLPVANGGTGTTTSTGSGNVVLSTSPTLATPALGTPSSVVLTNATGLPLTTGVTGTLPVANGGTGVTTSTGTGSVVLINSPTINGPTINSPTIGNLSGSYSGQVTFNVGSAGGGGSVQLSTPTTQSTNTILNLPVVTTTPDTLLSATATATLTNKTISGASNTLSNISLTTAVTGTLPISNGGTGVTTSTGTGNVVLSTSPVITGPYESVGISATALSGSVAASIAISNNAVYYYTANPTATWALNITNAPTTTGQSATVAILVNNGATAYLPSNITVNTVQAGASSSALPAQGATNNSITSYYQGASTWSADASTLDVYTITIICTGSSAWTLLLGLTKF